VELERGTRGKWLTVFYAHSRTNTRTTKIHNSTEVFFRHLIRRTRLRDPWYIFLGRTRRRIPEAQ
jgi:hypothetical protein